MAPNIPGFGQLPARIRDDLQMARCDKWYQNAQSPNQQLSLLNAYSSLKAANLWQYVKECPTNIPFKEGAMKFRVNDVEGLRRNLYERSDFTNPTRSPFDWLRGGNTLWDSRSKSSFCQLHLKQFKGEESDLMEAHIDLQGMNWYNPIQWYWHGFSNPWQDPFKVNQALITLPDVRLNLPPLFEPR